MNLESLNKILLLGKPRAFSREEFDSQMKYHTVEIVTEFSEDVNLVIEGKMLTPFEQNINDDLYENKNIHSVNIDVLEKELARKMDANTLLMSLKLSHDKERLKRFIQNSMISDELFFKLVKMYFWSKEDFFENDDNRDVSAAFIARFYENIERNHNVQYATTGFIHLVNQATSWELLKAISELEPMSFHPKIKMAVAMSVFIDESMQERFFKSNERHILEALSFNKKLKLSLVKELMGEVAFGENIAKTVELNDEKFELLRVFDRELGLNESLSLSMQKTLLGLDDEGVNLSLASNGVIDSSLVEILLVSENEDVQKALYENSATPVSILEKAYSDGEHHLALAKNESTPIEILYQLQLDSRYERAVKTNESFGKHIQSENIGWL